MDDDALDFAVAAWREGDRWVLDVLPTRTTDSLDALIAALRAHPGDSGTLGFVSIAEDFFVAIRVFGEQPRYLLSDVTAAHDWPLALEVAQRIGVEPPTDDELDDVWPVGDLRIFEDLGVSADEIELLCSDVDLYPDEMLAGVAARIGFGEQFDATLESIPD